MKIYKNQTEYNAKQNGFLANFSFSKDKLMSPDGVDVTVVIDKDKNKTYEITKFDHETNTCDIKVYSQKEYDSLVNK